MNDNNIDVTEGVLPGLGAYKDEREAVLQIGCLGKGNYLTVQQGIIDALHIGSLWFERAARLHQNNPSSVYRATSHPSYVPRV